MGQALTRHVLTGLRLGPFGLGLDLGLGLGFQDRLSGRLFPLWAGSDWINGPTWAAP